MEKENDLNKPSLLCPETFEGKSSGAYNVALDAALNLKKEHMVFCIYCRSPK
jgi:hypothetical protein